jgi:hypothetical protein
MKQRLFYVYTQAKGGLICSLAAAACGFGGLLQALGALRALEVYKRVRQSRRIK